MKRIASRRQALALLLAAFALATPARAEDVVYPAGSLVGLVPPPGLSVSTSFPGFEDRTKGVALALRAMPAEAYAQFESSDSAEGLKKLGMAFDKREALTLRTGKALLVIGHQNNIALWMLIAATADLTAVVTLQIADSAKDAYPDGVIRTAFESLSVRAEVPIDEQLGLLPFKVGALAGFKIAAVQPARNRIILADPADPGSKEIVPQIVVTMVPGQPPDSGDRDELAREALRGIGNLKDIRIISSGSLRMGGQQGHEIQATAKDPASGTDLTLVQWLRFGGGAFLHLIGIARTDAWTPAYGRFRAVRDGID